MTRKSLLISLSAFLFLVFLLSDVLLASPKVTQAALVNSADVRAIEEFGKPPRLDFFVLGKGRVFSVEWSEAFKAFPEPTYANPFLRFKTFNIKGLPQPIILAVAVAHGGSDSFYDSRIIAFQNGKFEMLTQGPLTNNDDGGIFIGYINKVFGYGLISWNFVWGDEEAHFEPHRYEIQVYCWNHGSQRFRWTREFTTNKKYQDWRTALKSLGFPSENLRDTVIGCEHSTLGFEERQD